MYAMLLEDNAGRMLRSVMICKCQDQTDPFPVQSQLYSKRIMACSMDIQTLITGHPNYDAQTRYAWKARLTLIHLAYAGTRIVEACIASTPTEINYQHMPQCPCEAIQA